MKKKLLAALVLSLAMAAPQAKADPSELEQALNDPNTTRFIMPSDQSISADLPLNTTRYFEINDAEAVTEDHYFNIIGNGHSGFQGDDGGGYTVSHLCDITGFYTTGNGGAFNMTNDASLVVISSIYNGDKEPLMTAIAENTAAGKGGAIYSDINWGGGVYLVNTNIEDNVAGDKGGGLYLDWGTNKIMALPGSVVGLVDNLAYINDSVVNNDVYLYSPRKEENSGGIRGSVTLMARATANDPTSPNPTGSSTIIIGDIRAEGSSDIRIASAKTDTAAGSVDIGSMSLDNDAMFSTQKVLPNSKTNISIVDMYLYRDSIINTVNGYIDDNLHITNILLDDSNNKFMVDASLMSDNKAIDSFGTIRGGTGKLAVNIIGSDTTSGTVRLSSHYSTATFADTTTQYGGLKYTFSQDPNDKGIFHYTTTKDRSVTLQEALQDWTLTEYDMPDLTVADSDLGNMWHYDDEGYFVERTLTINGNGGILITDGLEHSGIGIPHQLYPPEEDFLTPKLIINDLELMSGFTRSASNLDSFGTGGAIDAEDAVLELHNVTLSDNIAKGAGTTVDTNTFGMGGAVYLATKDGYERVIDPSTGGYIEGDHFKSIIEDSTFLNNKAISTQGSAGGFTGIVDGGGAVYSKGDLDVTGSLFASNSAISAISEGTAEGGALYLTNNSTLAGINCNVNIDDTMFMSNIAGDVIEEGDALLNTSAWGGALMASRVDLNISNSQFIDNKAYAAELYNGYTTVKGEAQGGAIHIDKILPTSNAINIDNSTFAMNEALAVDSATLSANNVDQSKAMGGAIAIMPSYAINKMFVNITNSDFVANKSGNGGAIYNKGSDLFIKDSTFTSNMATHYKVDPDGDTRWTEDMEGGAIFNAAGAKLSLDGVTFNNNYAKQVTYDSENNPIITTVKNDIRNDASSSGGLYFVGKASELDGGIIGNGYVHFNLDENEEMTIGENTNIIQSLIEVNSGTVNIVNADTMMGVDPDFDEMDEMDQITARSGLVVGENGTLNIMSGTIEITSKWNREIENSGNLYNGGTLDVTGAQYASVITNNENAILINEGTVLAKDLANSGIFYNQGTAEGNLANAESGIFANGGELTGDVDNSGTIGNLVGATIASTATFVNQANATVINGGSITAPTVTNSGTFLNGINPENMEEVVADASLTGNVTNLAQMYNAASIAGNVTNTGDFANDGNITGNVTNTAGDFVNDGTITGNLTNNFNGTFVNNAEITGNVNNDADFANKGAITGDVTNGVLENFENYGTISGNLDNDGEFLNNGTISGDVDNSGTLKSNLEDIGGTVNMSWSTAELELLNNGITFDDTNKSKIQGNKGTLSLYGDIVSNAVLDFSGKVNLNSGATVTLGENGDAFQSASKVILKDSTATLNLLNGTADALSYGSRLDIDSDSTLKLNIDWTDSLDAEDTYVFGDVEIAKLDLSNVEDGDSTTLFTNTIKNSVVIRDIDLITSQGGANTVTYYSSTGTLSAVRDTLANVIKTSDNNDDESAYYNYSMDSNEQGSTTNSVIGNLKVSGHGNSIVTRGLRIGDTIDSGNVILKDTNISNVNTTPGSGAILINNGSTLTIQAEEHDVSLSGTTGANKNVINIVTGLGGTPSTVAFEANNGKTITIDDDIVSNDINNKLYFNSGKIIANGLIDPITAVNTGADVTRGGQDADVQWDLQGGTLKYLSDSYLNNPAHLNSVEFHGGTLDLMNGVATTIALNDLSIVGSNSNLFVDADLAAGAMDRFTSTTTQVAPTPAAPIGTLNVAGINLLSDGKTDKTTINFTSDPNLLGGNHIKYTGSSALSRIFKYNVEYNDTTGDFDFTRMASGSYKDYNPGVLAAPIAAQLGGYLTQLNSYDQAFMNMDTYMMMPSSVRTALKMRNKMASLENAQYDDTTSMYDYAAGWFRPYATFENVPLHNGPRVSNVMYGSFFGGESPLYDLGHGWDGMWGAYIGYNGSHQAYDGVGIYQNGGTLGLTGMAYKNNFFVGGTVNVGAAGAEASTAFGSDDFAMLMTGAALKTGYNWELASGKFIIQPSLMASYSFVNTFNSRSSAGVAIESDPLHAVTIEPGVKFIGNLKNGWQPYAGISMVFNIMDRTRFQANDVSLPNFSINPFVRYGVGVRKTWGERLTGHFQTYFTNGGRNGVGLSAGLRWAVGKEGTGEIKGQTPELRPTKITLNNHK